MEEICLRCGKSPAIQHSCAECLGTHLMCEFCRSFLKIRYPRLINLVSDFVRYGYWANSSGCDFMRCPTNENLLAIELAREC